MGRPSRPNATLLDLADLLRTYHEQRPADVHSDLLAVSLVVERWDAISRYASELVDMACRHSEVGIADLAALAVARANKLPLLTGVAELAGVDPDSRNRSPPHVPSTVTCQS